MDAPRNEIRQNINTFTQMKIALLQCGFIRDIDHIHRTKRFVDKNNKHEIDVFLQTYDIIGYPQKTDLERYKSSKKTDIELIKSIIPIKGFEILDPFNVNAEAREVYPKNPGRYCQWNMVFRASKLIKDYEYDIVIRSRPDYYIKHFNLDNYPLERISKEKIIIAKTKPLSELFLRRPDNKKESQIITPKGKVINFVHFDGFAMGGKKQMMEYCEIGNAKVFLSIAGNKKISDLLPPKMKGANNSSEFIITYYTHEVLENSLFNVQKPDIPSQPIFRKEKYFK